MKLTGIRLLIILNFPMLCHAQNPRFEHISTQQKLSNSTVTSIVQDDQGFIWVGTRDGVNKYDGYQFITFRNDPKDSNSLSHNFVSDLKTDKNGNLWVATKDGLNKLDLKTFRFTRYMHDKADPHSISANACNKLAIDLQGNVWIATQRGGLECFNPRENIFKHHLLEDPEDPPVNSNNIRSVFTDSQGRLWIASSEGPLRLYDKNTGTFTRFPNREMKTGKTIGKYIACIFEDSRKQLWIGTLDNGLFLFDPSNGVFTHYKQIDQLQGGSNTRILSINEDDRGHLWVGSENGGLWILDQKTGTSQNFVTDEIDPYSIKGNSISPIYRDIQGNMWLGSFSAGLNLHKKSTESFVHYRRNSGKGSISNNFIWDFVEDRNKNIWVATDGGGVDKLDGKTGRKINYRKGSGKNELSDNYVLTISEDNDGRIWMGTWGQGVSIFDPGASVFTYLKHDARAGRSLNEDYVFDIIHTSDQKTWLGTAGGGLNCYDRKSRLFTYFRHNPNDVKSISSNFIISLLEDKMGNLWVGTYDNGLNLLDRKTNTFTRYINAKQGNGLSNNSVSDVFEDSEGNIWIGTSDGLNKFNPVTNAFTVFKTDQGLPGNIIYAVREDDNNKIWISTNKGLSMHDPSGNSFRNYTTEDGLQHDEFKPRAALKASDGRLYFGGINGFNVFSPAGMVKPAKFSPIVITSFRIFNKPDINSARNDHVPGLVEDIANTKRISLSYKQTFFSIEYAALDYYSPDKKEYAFMLERFDKEWNYVGSRNNTSYTNVPPGDYTFKVMYQNTAGLWSPEHSLLQISVLPPFWLTWWFKVLAAFACIGCILGYVSIRIKSIKKQKQKLELLVRKKTGEVVAQKEALEEQQVEINDKNNSLLRLITEKDRLLMEKEWLLKEIHHRVKNNFHIVASLLEIQSSYLQNKDALSAIKESQHRIHSMSIIHQKLYQSENLSTVDMPEYIYELVAYLRESYGLRENIRFDLKIEKIGLNHAYAITLGLILNEAITNSIKYAFPENAGGKISISLSCISKSEALLSIADNGRGLPTDMDTGIGTSMGMELLRGLTTDLAGNFSIENSEGTHIKVIFDYKAAAAQEDVSFL